MGLEMYVVVALIAVLAYNYLGTPTSNYVIDKRDRGALGAKVLSDLAKSKGMIVLDTGVVVHELKEGEGSHFPTDRSEVSMKYIMMDFERVVLDTSYHEIKAYNSHMASLIPGWRHGLKTMTEGGISEIYIPGNLAYGERGIHNLQKNELIIIEVELITTTRGKLTPEGEKIEAKFIKIESEIKAIESFEEKEKEEQRGPFILLEKGLKYRNINKGLGKHHPMKTAEVLIKYTGWLTKNGEVFDANEQEGAVMGQDTLIEGWKLLLPYMVEGQRIETIIPWQLAYGEKGRGSIPAKADLTFEIELVQIQGDYVKKGSLHLEL